MKIQILGTGCAKCQLLTVAAEKAAQSLNRPYEIEKVTDFQEIIGFGVMNTPALAVDGKVKVAGRVPTVDELKKLLA